MKKKIFYTLFFAIIINRLDAQIGLLQTNSTISENAGTAPPKNIIDISPDYSSRIKLEEGRTRDTEIVGGVSLARRYFVSHIQNNYENIKDSISVLKKLSIFFFKECTSTDYQMWNYFVQFHDSTLVVKNHKQLVDSLSFAYGEFYQTYAKTDDNKDEIKEIEIALKSLQDIISKGKDISVAMTEAQITSAEGEFNRLSGAIDEKIKSLNKTIKQDIETLRIHQKTYNRIVNTFFTIKEKKVDTKEFAALPQVTSVIGEREIVPGIQMLGSKILGDIDKDFVTGEMGLLLGMQSNPDKPNLKTLFVDQASSFHLFTHFNYGFGAVNKEKPEKANLKRLCINLHASYSIKKILTDTLKTTKVINPSLFHTQMGIELAVIARSLTLYSNVNTLTLFDKLAEFESALGIGRKFYGYIDCGAKILLDPSQSLNINNAKIFVNANFIINSGDVRYVTRSKDTVIPNIQIGIKASL